MDNTNKLRLVTLHPDKDPQQCDEVVRNTEEYRKRPLTTPDFPLPPGEKFNPDKHIQYALNELKQLVQDLCVRAGIWRADETLSAAAADWFGRNTAVFLTETASTEEGHAGWMHVAKIYCHVLDELVADINWFRSEGNRVFSNGRMSPGRRHAFKSHMALHASAVFVSAVHIFCAIARMADFFLSQLARTPSAMLERMVRCSRI